MKTKTLQREDLAKIITQRILQEKETIKERYKQSKNKIGYFYIDNLLPKTIIDDINKAFPSPNEMSKKKSLRENKYVSAQMNKHPAILEEIIFAFQDNKVVHLIKQICEIEDLYPDDNLYAGGISSMGKNQFLNPHLDNSHDKDRNRWRVLNLLFYVSPDWKETNGGHLELWPNGLTSKPIIIHSKYNRLAVMATHQSSWHSVSPVTVNASRNCVSNYYFSNSPIFTTDKFHVTTFRGRPEQKIRNQILKIDSYLRMGIRKIFKKGVIENPHKYNK